MPNRGTPFKVPENYFEDLEKNILSQVKNNPKKKYFFSEIKTVYKYAASLLILFVLGGTLWFNLPSTTKNNSTTQLAKTTIKETTKIEEAQSIKENKIVQKREIETKILPVQEAKQISSVSTIQRKDITNDELKLTEEELQYLEYYLQGDIINDYLTYNSIEK